MDVILLRHVSKLGRVGDVVSVKPGYARNFLLPQKLALRASKENLHYYESKKTHFEEKNQQYKHSAEDQAKVLTGLWVTLIRQAGENGHLYGSVTSKDIKEAIKNMNIPFDGNVLLQKPIKELGVFEAEVSLHAEVSAFVKVNVAPSDEEAEKQKQQHEKISVQ